MPDPRSEYERGVETGGIISRLEGHDKHFAKINGSLDAVAEQLAALVLAVQRLGDQAVARDATVVTTALALKDANDARRTADDDHQRTTDRRWTPTARLITVVTVLVALAGLVVTLIVLGQPR